MVATQFIALERRIRTDLEQLRHQLGLVQSSLVVATQALKMQDAEQDRDIANLLEFDVGGRLERQIQRASALIVSLENSFPDRLPDAVESGDVRMC